MAFEDIKEGLRNVVLVVGVLMGATILAGTAVYVINSFNTSSGGVITSDVNLLGKALPFLGIIGIIAGVAVLIGILWPTIESFISK